jgi:hypothetical protein
LTSQDVIHKTSQVAGFGNEEMWRRYELLERERNVRRDQNAIKYTAMPLFKQRFLLKPLLLVPKERSGISTALACASIVSMPARQTAIGI